MLSHLHIIISPEKSDPELIGQFPASFSYLFNVVSGEKVNNTFQLVFSNGSDKPFSLTVDANNVSDDINNFWLDKLCLILCHPQYIRVNNRLMVCIHGAETSFVKKLEEQLINQGFFDVLFVNTGTPQDSSFMLYDEDISNEDGFYHWYVQRLNDSASAMNILAFFKDKEWLGRLLTWQGNAETRLHSEQPLTYRLISQLQEKSAELNGHRLLIEELTKDLSSKKAYLDYVLGRFKEDGNDDVNVNALMKIKKFYYNEYEILPVWYKRFGHILKVVIGKRTFRSLFNDNVKKYKD